MSIYDIKVNTNKKYPIIIYSVSYINPISELDNISKDLRNRIHKECDVLFDLLLTNGEEFNRFAIGHFDGYNINFASINTVKIINNKDLGFINNYYKQNIKILNKGVLTASEKLKYINS